MSRVLFSSWSAHARVLATAVLLVGGVKSGVFADPAPTWSDGELARFAEVIAVGTVIDVRAEVDSAVDSVYTLVTLDASRVIKGDVADRRITVKLLGGPANGLALVVPGQARFVPGESVLVFLERRPRDRSLYPVAMWQGKWRLALDSVSGTRLAIRERTDGSTWGAFGPARDVRILDRFIRDLNEFDSNGGEQPTTRVTQDSLVAHESLVRAAQQALVAQSFSPAAQQTLVAKDLGPAGKTGLEGAAVAAPPISRRGTASESQTLPVLFEPGRSQAALAWNAAVARAASAWNAAQSAVRLVDDGAATSRCAIGVERSGRTSVGLATSCGELAPTGSVVGFSGAYLQTDVRSGGSATGLLHGFLLLNDAIVDFTGDAPDGRMKPVRSVRLQPDPGGCLDQVATREIGHLARLRDGGSISGDDLTSVLSRSCGTASPIFHEYPSRGVSAADLARLAPAARTVPSAPRNLAVSVSGSSVLLTWSQPAAGTPESYVVEAGSLPDFADLAAVSSGSAATFLRTKGVNPGAYFVRVRAVTSDGMGPASNEVLVTTGGAVGLPGPPTALTSAVIGSTLVLTWTPPSTSEPPSAYIVEAGSFAGASDLALIVTGNHASTFAITGVGAGSYYLRVRAANQSGAGPASNDVVATVRGATREPASPMVAWPKAFFRPVIKPLPPSATPTLPATSPATPQGSWTSQDIGHVEAPGSLTVAGGIMTVKASGADIWGESDAFRYAYQTLTGNGQIVARLVSLQDTNPWAKAGVMIREDPSDGSRYVALVVSASSGLAFQRRTDPYGAAVYTPASGAAPTWVKLVRSGNTFTAYRSNDGSSWLSPGSVTIPLTATVSAGLAVTSHADGILTTAVFDNVTITAGDTPSNPPPRVSLAAPAEGASFDAPASVTLTATASDSNGTITRVDFYAGSLLIGAAKASPYRFVWSNVPAGSYSLTAIATDNGGASTSSSAVGIRVKAQPLPAGALVQSNHLIYEGAFRLPLPGDGIDSFAYGGTAIAYNPSRGSLYIVGHDWAQRVAEVSVPPARNTASLSELSTAALLQPFADVTDGRMSLVNPTDPNSKKIGGLLVYRDKLYVSAYSYYDANSTQLLSHFVSDLDLSLQGDVRGPYRLGDVGAGFVSGYFSLVPQAWQAALGGPVLNGQCCLAIASRTSWGPAAFAIDPTTIGVEDPAPAAALAYYPQNHPTLGAWDGSGPYYNGTTAVTGVVFPEGTRSVLFFGRHGLGAFCYGTGDECRDPVDGSKGTHGYPYASYVWAYDAGDLAAVRRGEKHPWDVRPYAVWPLNLPFAPVGVRLNGATYDPATGRIFVSQGFGDGVKPLIHVFSIGSPSSSVSAGP